MVRGGRNLSGSTLLARGALSEGEGQDPLGSMANLMDVMLVFVCGLLLALVAHWGVDLGSASASSESDMTEIEGELEESSQTTSDEASGYEEIGTAYRDAETGRIYVVAP